MNSGGNRHIPVRVPKTWRRKKRKPAGTISIYESNLPPGRPSNRTCSTPPTVHHEPDIPCNPPPLRVTGTALEEKRKHLDSSSSEEDVHQLYDFGESGAEANNEFIGDDDLFQKRQLESRPCHEARLLPERRFEDGSSKGIWTRTLKTRGKNEPYRHGTSLKPWELLYSEDVDGRRRYILRAGQLPLPLFRELICRFSQPGDRTVDLFAGTGSAAIAPIRIPNEEMRVFVGTELDENVYNSGMERVQNAFASILADETQRAESFPRQEFPDDVIEAAKLISLHKRTRKRARSIWGPPAGLPVLSVLPKYITQYMLLRLQQMHLAGSITWRPFHEWPVDLQGKMHSLNFDELLALECANTGLYVAPSKVKHRDAGLGVFANRSFAKNEFTAPYYGRLIYDDLSDRAHKTRMYGEGFTACDVNEFLVYNMILKVSRECHFQELLPNEHMRSKIPYREVYVVPFTFNVAARISDPWYVEGDEDYLSSVHVLRECNVTFVQK